MIVIATALVIATTIEIVTKLMMMSRSLIEMVIAIVLATATVAVQKIRQWIREGKIRKIKINNDQRRVTKGPRLATR